METDRRRAGSGGRVTVPGDAKVALTACGESSVVSVAGGNATVHSQCGGIIAPAEGTHVTVDGTGTLQSTALFVLHGVEGTTVRSSGANVIFGDFAGFVFGEAGTELAFTNAGGRAVVFGDGCTMELDNSSATEHRVVFGTCACVGLPTLSDFQGQL